MTVKQKLDHNRRYQESYSDALERILQEVEVYREETELLLMNKVMKE